MWMKRKAPGATRPPASVEVGAWTISGSRSLKAR